MGWEDPLEEGMATHSSILAWNPDGQEPGDTVHGVTKSQHDWATKHSTAQQVFYKLQFKKSEEPQRAGIVYLCKRENQAEELRVLPAQD